MSYASEVRGYISNKALGELIFTRELLHLAPRGSVDTTIYRMIKVSALIRIGQAIFLRAGSVVPPIEEVVKAKAEVYGRTIVSHGKKLCQEFGLIREEISANTLCISSSTTQFTVCDQIFNFKSTCGRKLFLGERIEGKAIRALWKLGREAFKVLPSEKLDELQSNCAQPLKQLARWMPAWMSDRFVRDS